MNTQTSARRDTESAATAGPAVATPGAPIKPGEVARGWGKQVGAASPTGSRPGRLSRYAAGSVHEVPHTQAAPGRA